MVLRVLHLQFHLCPQKPAARNVKPYQGVQSSGEMSSFSVFLNQAEQEESSAISIVSCYFDLRRQTPACVFARIGECARNKHDSINYLRIKRVANKGVGSALMGMLFASGICCAGTGHDAERPRDHKIVGRSVREYRAYISHTRSRSGPQYAPVAGRPERGIVSHETGWPSEISTVSFRSPRAAEGPNSVLIHRSRAGSDRPLMTVVRDAAWDRSGFSSGVSRPSGNLRLDCTSTTRTRRAGGPTTPRYAAVRSRLHADVALQISRVPSSLLCRREESGAARLDLLRGAAKLQNMPI